MQLHRKHCLLIILFILVAGFSYYRWKNGPLAPTPIINDIPSVDFDVSLQTEQYSQVVNVPWRAEIYRILKLLYEAYKPAYITPSNQLKIPKKIHQIWLGSPFPEEYKAFQQSWITHNPDWEYILWTETEVNAMPMQNRQLYDAATNYGEKSDIARYEILYQHGGLYVDTDFECLKPMLTFHYLYDFYIGIQPLDTNIMQLGVGIIGAAREHPLLKIAIDSLPHSKTRQVIARTGPLYFTDIFCSHAFKVPGINIAMPPTYFYPRGYTQSVDDRTTWIRPESYAVHHWAGSWLKPEGFVRR